MTEGSKRTFKKRSHATALERIDHATVNELDVWAERIVNAQSLHELVGR